MTEAAPPRIVMDGVRRRFGATTALDGVGFSVRPGEIHALVGENGAGKSTLMKILSGALRPDAGTLELDGRPFRPASPLAARRAGVAMIYQELSLADHLDVGENIVLGMEPRRMGWVRRGRVRDRARQALARLGREGLDPDRPVRSLSVADRQVVEIARALAVGCRVLVLDEPTSSLGRADTERLFDVVRALRAQGLGIVYISHFIEEVQALADRFTVLRDGRVAGAGDARTAAPDDIIGLMVGRRLDRLYPRSPRTPGEAVLSLAGLAGRVHRAPVDLALRRGEVLGIGGLVGAGRTELLRAVFGLDPVRAGTVRVAAWSGRPTAPGSLARGVGLVSEDRKGEGLAQAMSVADNLCLSRLEGLGPAGWIMPGRQRGAAAALIRALDIRGGDPGSPVHALSGGNQQKVAVARLLHHGVDVFLLDEPTRGIDVASKARIYRLVDDVTTGRDRERPGAVLLVSSYLPELLGVCDRVAVMSRGILGTPRPVAEWDEHRLMVAALGREAA